MVETLSPMLPNRVGRMAGTLLRRSDAAGLMLATAESCTGGLLASLLTDIEGYGHVFDRGFVAYSELAKCQLLGISPTQIDHFGAVSKQVAVAMAEGALKESNAQLALAITGFAGPGDPDDEPGRCISLVRERAARPATVKSISVISAEGGASGVLGSST